MKDAPYLRRYIKAGRVYYYVRRHPKGQGIRLYAEPGTPEFWAEYALAVKGRPAPPPTRSVAGLVERYLSSQKWAKLAPNTQKSYRQALDYIRDKIGPADPRKLRRRHIIDMRDALADTPTTANRRINVMKALLEYGIDIDWISENVARGVESLPPTGRTRHPWPQDMIEAFRAQADPDTLLIFELALGTGQRIGDVLRMQWAHVEADSIRVKQGKTGASVWIPWTAHLARVVASAPRRGLFIACQPNGRPWSYNGAWNRIRAAREAIGAEAYDIHALRHNAASELAEAGCTDEEIAAITGHKSSALVRLYSREAAQKARARKAQQARNGTKPKREL